MLIGALTTHFDISSNAFSLCECWRALLVARALISAAILSPCVTSGTVASGYGPDVLKQQIARAFSASHSLTFFGVATSAPDETSYIEKALQHENQTLLTNSSLGYHSESPPLYRRGCHAGSRCRCMLEQRRNHWCSTGFAAVTRVGTELTQRDGEPTDAQCAHDASWRVDALAFRGAAGDGAGHAGV
jgi:hypothetical protein